MQYCHFLFISALLVSGCSGSGDTDTSASTGTDLSTGTDSSVALLPADTENTAEKFIGTWVACREDSTAESTRITFVFDGVSAFFKEEYIQEAGCFNVPSSSDSRSGSLVFESPIADTALGFMAYPITFIDSDAESADVKNLLYTDSSLLYFGITSSTNEPPTALDTWVTYQYSGSPDFAVAAF